MLSLQKNKNKKLVVSNIFVLLKIMFCKKITRAWVHCLSIWKWITLLFVIFDKSIRQPIIWMYWKTSMVLFWNLFLIACLIRINSIYGKWFEPRSISCLSSVIVRVRVVFRKTVVGDWRFDYLSGSHLQSQVKSLRQMMVFMPLVKLIKLNITTKLTNQTHDLRHKYHHLTKTLHLTLRKRMTTALVVETSVTNNNNSLSKDYPHPNDHAGHLQITSSAEEEHSTYIVHTLIIDRWNMSDPMPLKGSPCLHTEKYEMPEDFRCLRGIFDKM